VEYHLSMAVTFSVRAGSSFKTHVRYWQPGKLELVDTSGYTARVQLRSANGSQRVLMNTREVEIPTGDPVPTGTILALLEPGHWRLLLNAGITRTLPPVTRVEVELVNDLDPDDVTSLMVGTVNVTPQGVSNE